MPENAPIPVQCLAASLARRRMANDYFLSLISHLGERERKKNYHVFMAFLCPHYSAVETIEHGVNKGIELAERDQSSASTWQDWVDPRRHFSHRRTRDFLHAHLKWSNDFFSFWSSLGKEENGSKEVSTVCGKDSFFPCRDEWRPQGVSGKSCGRAWWRDLLQMNFLPTWRGLLVPA